MPAPLRVFNPQFNFNYDRKIGPEASLDISTNLLELSSLWKGEAPKETKDSKHPLKYQLELNFTGRKSLTKQFYQTKTNLALSRIRTGNSLRN